MNKAEFVRAVAAQAGVTIKTVEAVLSEMEAVILENLSKKEETNLTFLKIKTVEKPARAARNPGTGATIEIPAKTAVKIDAMSAMKKAANGG